MAINVNENGVLKPLNIETSGWNIKGLDFLGELIYSVPGKTDTVITATSNDPLVTIKGEVISDNSKWLVLNLDRPIGDYKYIIFIPEAQPGNTIGYFKGTSTTNGVFPVLFNPTEMWRVWNFKGYNDRNGYGFPINTTYLTCPWLIIPKKSTSYLMNELTDNVLYIYNTNNATNWYLTILGLR